MKIVYMRSNSINPDPRVEKEMSAAIGCGHIPIGIGWNRNKAESKLSKEKIYLSNGSVDVYRFNIDAEFGSGLKNLIPLIKWQVCLIKWLIKNRKKYDLIHACDFDTVLAALFMRILFNKKYVYDIFDFYVDAFSVPNSLKGIIKKIDFFAIKKAEVTILTNESRIEQISGSNPKEIAFIHNTPKEIQDITLDKVVKNNKKRIFYGGILPENRMIEEVIKICSRHPEWEFIIAGFGPIEQKCREYAEKLDNIKFLGKIQYKDIIKNTINSDVIFACYDPSVPNHKYSSPNKLYEAMMCKKPIIVCNGTGIDKLVIEKNIGLTCDFNEESLEECFISIFEDENKYKCMANNSRFIYDSEYKWSIMSKRLENIYKNIKL